MCFHVGLSESNSLFSFVCYMLGDYSPNRTEEEEKKRNNALVAPGIRICCIIHNPRGFALTGYSKSCNNFILIIK